MIRHNIDHIVLREGQLFSYGWGFCPGSEIVSMVLHLDFGSAAQPIEVKAEYGHQRDDLAAFYPDVPEARNAGFLLITGFVQKKIIRASLHWELKDQRVVDTLIDLSQINGEAVTQSLSSRYKYLFWKSITLLRSSGVGALIRKARRSFPIQIRPHDESEWGILCAKLRGQLLAVVVDHDMGGGANIYRNLYVTERCAKGETVLLLGFHVNSLQYFVDVFHGRSSHRHIIGSPEDILFLASHGKVQHLVYNCAVSFRQPLAVINMLEALKNRNSGCQLIVMVHDYFVICPSHFLIDSKGKFCDIPDKNYCQDCLQKHRDGFVSLGGTKDISLWRNSWFKLLSIADEVRMFSESSKRLLKKAYPSLNDAVLSIVPHALPLKMSNVRLAAGHHLHIGIVGSIGVHKGANIVRDLASVITQSNSNAKITVIGTIDVQVCDEVVTVTGPYETKQLAQMIKKSGANIFLFPSIVSETFSYVAHELAAMNVPFACFDIGAPADLARTYEGGLVLSSMEPNKTLHDLERFWHKTYQITEKRV
jgi:glycosyltransferase involved in cell wall biosynthesis